MSLREFLKDYARDEHLAKDTSPEFARQMQAKSKATDDQHKQLHQGTQTAAG